MGEGSAKFHSGSTLNMYGVFGFVPVIHQSFFTWADMPTPVRISFATAAGTVADPICRAFPVSGSAAK